MKKVSEALRLFLLVALIAAFVNVSPPHPSLAASSPSLAMLMPADTFSYTEINTSDVPGMVKNLQAFLTKAGIPATFVEDLNKSLTQSLGRPASLDKDVYPWLGDKVGIGIYVPASLFQALFTRAPMPSSATSQPFDAYFVATVKDEPALDTFLKDVVASGAKSSQVLTPTQRTFGSTTVTVYSDPKGNGTLARWKGYVAIGSPSLDRMLAMLKGDQPTLADNANYKKVVGMLKPNNMAVTYTNTPMSPVTYIGLLALLGPSIGHVFESIIQSLQTPGPNPTDTPTPTPTPTPLPQSQDVANTILESGATAVGLYGDAHSISTDWAFYVKPESLQKLFTLLKVQAQVDLKQPAKTISLHMADQISNKAVFVILGSDLSTMTKNAVTLARMGAALSDLISGTTSSSTGFESAYAQVQGGLKAGFRLDLNNDVLSWLNGDFALYTVIDADSLKSGQLSSNPFTQALLVETDNTSAAQNFITKINTGLPTLAQLTPTKNSNGLYNIAVPSVGSVDYGLAKNTFVVSAGKDPDSLISAMNGDGTLSSDADWKAAAALAPQAYQHFWYLNLTKVDAALQPFVSSSSSSSDKQMLALLGLFKNAVLYSTDQGGGASLSTLVITLN